MKKVLFIDSGSGGINVLAECLKQKVSGNYLYFADMKHSPYGDKSVSWLQNRATEILQTVEKFFRFDIVVLACNTLTTSAVGYLREKYPNVIFIGVEPAVKPALKEFDKKDILLMATERTLQNLGVEGVVVPALPRLIDEHLFAVESLKDYLWENLKKHKNKKAIVLGCTHYCAVKKILKELFPNVKIYDSDEGVTKRLKSFVGEGGYLVQFMTSGEDDISIFSKYCQKLVKIF